MHAGLSMSGAYPLSTSGLRQAEASRRLTHEFASPCPPSLGFCPPAPAYSPRRFHRQSPLPQRMEDAHLQLQSCGGLSFHGGIRGDLLLLLPRGSSGKGRLF
jgi:hypothetical protein